MTGLKKIFPLSFKFTKSSKDVLLGMLVYSAIAAAVTTVGIFALSLLYIPFYFIGLIPVIGWFIILPISVTVYTVAVSTVSFFATAYTYAGIAINIIAYTKSENAAE